MADGRVAMYTKIHHGLVDGISAMRLMASTMSSDPDERGMAAPWAARAVRTRTKTSDSDTPATDAARTLASLPSDALRTAIGITAEAAGMPGALIKTLSKGVRNETSTMSLHTPRTMFNRNITSARRFAAQDWPVERIRAIGKATGATINDVVLAMCGGAIRTYLIEHDGLPDTPLVAMVPIGLKAKESHLPSAEGGNAVGAVMARLGTDQADPADRLRAVQKSMKDGKDALKSTDAGADPGDERDRPGARGPRPALKLSGIIRSPYNLIISNVPGAAHHAVLERRQAGRQLPAVDPDPRDGAQHHLHVVRRQHGLRPHRLPAHGPAPAAVARLPRRRGRRAREGSRHLTTPWFRGSLRSHLNQRRAPRIPRRPGPRRRGAGRG